MATLISVADEQIEPLLYNSSLHLPPQESSDGKGEEIATSEPGGSPPRLVSLDVFRGLTVALMILVDNAGGAFPSINHSPWFGVTLADFVMPFFLFGVGFSISLVFKLTLTMACIRLVSNHNNARVTGTLFENFLSSSIGNKFVAGSQNNRNYYAVGTSTFYIAFFSSLQEHQGFKAPNRIMATKKVIQRTIKLFLLGLLLQGLLLLPATVLQLFLEKHFVAAFLINVIVIRTGGYIHGGDELTYGIDVTKIRLLGILQRIAIGYLLASLSEIWLVNNIMVDNPIAFVKKYYMQWMAALIIILSYMSLLYGLFVPNWEFRSPSVYLSTRETGTQTVRCGVRGSLQPPCNAVGYIDRIILGEQHLYQHPVYGRTKECSVNSPDYGPLPPNSPAWCLAPFDPEGILSSLMAAITCFMGLYFGHLHVHSKDPTKRMLSWSISSVVLLISGYGLMLLGIPFCKALYTFSYMCITTGASGLLLTVLFYIWLGMNALIVYALATTNIIPAAVRGFYWQSPENNLISFFAHHLAHSTKRLLQVMHLAKKWRTLGLVMLEILFWCLFSGYLHMKGIYVKL